MAAFDTPFTLFDSFIESGGAILTDFWCQANYGGDPVMVARCRGGSRMDSVLYPNPPMPRTVPPPPLTESGNSAIPYDTIQDYLIAAQQAGQRIQTQNFFTATADGLDVYGQSETNWLMLGLVAVGVVFVVKKVL